MNAANLAPPQRTNAPPTAAPPSAESERGERTAPPQPTAAAPGPPPAAGPAYPRRITVPEYHAMLEAGVFPGDGAGLELLDGFLTQKPMPHPLHSGTVRRVTKTIEPLLPADWEVRTQDSVTFLTSEPLPDLVVVPVDPHGWLTRHPAPDDCAVLIEVSDSTLWLDRNRKARLYAAAGVSPYWVVNLIARRVEVHDEPSPGDGTEENPPGYRRRDVSPGEALSFRYGDATITLDAADLLPPAGET